MLVVELSGCHAGAICFDRAVSQEPMIDQQLGEGPALRIAPELADPVGALEVRQRQDLEQFGAGSRPEGVQALSEVFRRSSSSGLITYRPSLLRRRRPVGYAPS